MLTTDIDLNGSKSEQWTPIGNNTPYTGTFDGQRHTISGLSIDSDAQYAGLFARISEGGTVKNLTLTDSYININSGNSTAYVGGICGWNDGRIENCSNSGDVTVTGSGDTYVGGICGYNDGSIENCDNSGSVEGSGSGGGGNSTAYVGGICGLNWDSIENCDNSGSVEGNGDLKVGGICGWNDGRIENCSNSGTVTGSGYVGGICGVNYGGTITNCSNSGDVSVTHVGGICGVNYGSITNCSNSGTVTGSGYVGGICGVNYGGIITNCSNSGDVTGSGYVGGICGMNSRGNITNCYWLQDTASNGVDSGSGEATKKSEGEYKSGEVAWLLNEQSTNGPWRQNLGEGGDSVPILDPTHGTVVQLTFNANTGNEEDNSYQYANSGDTVSVPEAPDYPGHTFVGWYDNAAFSGAPVTGITTTDFGDKTYYAKWTANTYKVTLNANGGTIAGGKDVTNYTYGTATALPTEQDITRTGYTFDGWYEDENFSSSVVKAIPDNATGEKTYYAKWTANTYTVTLNTNNGTIADGKEVTSYTYGTATMLPTEQDITHTGLNFGGWYDNAAFSGAPVTGITTTDFGDKTYYAKWTAEVTLNTNGGTVNSGNITDYTYGTETTLPTDVTRAGYTFAGWYENEALSGEPETVIPDDATGAKTYYAKWTANTYTVTLNTKGGTIADGKGVTSYTYGTETTLPTAQDITRTGYTFAGWYDNEALSGEPETVIPANAMGDKEYWAKWTAKSYPSTPSVTSPTVSEETIDAIQAADPGETVTVDLSSGSTKLDKEVFETLAGRDVTLVVELGEGVSWTVNGSDIPENADFTDIDMGVTMNSDGIPVEVVNAITGERGSVQITLAHDGAFGFTMTMTAPLGAENAGLWANLYHYKVNDGEAGREGPLGDNEEAGTMTFETAAPIGSDGSVSLSLSHASQYAIVIDDHNHGIVTLPFTDVSADDWFYDPVCYVYSQGLMTGTSATTFEPNTSLSRAMLVAVLHRLEGSPAASAGDFSDVASGDWYAQAVNWAASVGVVNGFDDGTFQPNAAITREQMAAILRNYAEYKGIDVTASGDLVNYSDAASVSDWAKESVAWAVDQGLISGMTVDTLQPQGLSTRAQVAAVLQRYLAN